MCFGAPFFRVSRVAPYVRRTYSCTAPGVVKRIGLRSKAALTPVSATAEGPALRRRDLPTVSWHGTEFSLTLTLKFTVHIGLPSIHRNRPCILWSRTHRPRGETARRRATRPTRSRNLTNTNCRSRLCATSKPHQSTCVAVYMYRTVQL